MDVLKHTLLQAQENNMVYPKLKVMKREKKQYDTLDKLLITTYPFKHNYVEKLCQGILKIF